jgi:transcriptional regulator with XRE-family HTH domain
VAEKLSLNVAVGRAVRRWRAQHRVSQEELGLRCGIDRTYIGHIERAEKQPTLGTIEKLLEGTGMTFSEMAELAEREQVRQSP